MNDEEVDDGENDVQVFVAFVHLHLGEKQENFGEEVEVADVIENVVGDVIVASQGNPHESNEVDYVVELTPYFHRRVLVVFGVEELEP